MKKIPVNVKKLVKEISEHITILLNMDCMIISSVPNVDVSNIEDLDFIEYDSMSDRYVSILKVTQREIKSEDLNRINEMFKINYIDDADGIQIELVNENEFKLILNGSIF